MNRWKYSKRWRLFIEFWTAGVLFHTFYYLLPIGFLAFIIVNSLSDFLLFNRENHAKNVIINTVSIISYELLSVWQFEKTQIPILDPFVFGIYHLFFSQFIFAQWLKFRVDNQDYI